MIIPRINQDGKAMTNAVDDSAVDADASELLKDEDKVIEKGLEVGGDGKKLRRRIDPSLVPVPLPSLCRVREGSNYLYTLHGKLSSICYYELVSTS